VNSAATPFHLLLGARDWKPRLEEATNQPTDRPSWDTRSTAVTLRRENFRFPARSLESPFSTEDRRGAARDLFGHTYWIAEDRHTILYRPAGATRSARFWSIDDLGASCPAKPNEPGAFEPCPDPPPIPTAKPRLSGLTVTTRHFLVVGTIDPGGLLVFDLHGSGPPVWQLWPSQVPFAPFDMAATPSGGAWVLDRHDDGTRLWRLDRDLRVVRAGPETTLEEPAGDHFRPAVPDASGGCEVKGRTFPTGISLDLASPPLPAAGDAVSVAALPDGTALVMESDESVGDTHLHRWALRCWAPVDPVVTDGVPLAAGSSLNEALADLFDEATKLIGHDMAFLPDPEQEPGRVSGTVYVVDVGGNQSFAFALNSGIKGAADSQVLDLVALYSYLPMRRFGGKALIEGSGTNGGEAYYDHADTWLPLTELPRPRYARRGVVDRIVFDGKEPRCVWHRLFLDACIPPGDSVDVESRAADREEDLAGVPWQPEPSLRLRSTGPELAYTETIAAEHTRLAGVGTWELLFQAAHGRFLELRLTLRGSGRSSPKIHALRAHYPRPSYLRYLPATYREDPDSASFLDRFLANFEGVFTDLESRIAAAQVVFDAQTAPEEALDWLATWLGATLDEGWDARRRRLFLAHAVEIYRRRGTARGIVEATRLALDPCVDESLFAEDWDGAVGFGVRLMETFRTRSLPSVLLGDATAVAGPRTVSVGERWQPDQGGARLQRLYRNFLLGLYADPADPENDAAALARLNDAWETGHTSMDQVIFDVKPPKGPAAVDWRSFAGSELGITMAEEAADDGGWRDFLRQRYGGIAALNLAWGLVGDLVHSSFDAISLPDAGLPPDGEPLADWYLYAAVAVPQEASAHRFTLLIPVGSDVAPIDRQQLLDRAHAVVDREKPAHTAFDVRLYWALFRAGSARVGFDTLLGEGSRLTAIVLGAGALGQGLVGEGHPWNLADRLVSGRDTVAASRVPGRDTAAGPPPLA